MKSKKWIFRSIVSIAIIAIVLTGIYFSDRNDNAFKKPFNKERDVTIALNRDSAAFNNVPQIEGDTINQTIPEQPNGKKDQRAEEGFHVDGIKRSDAEVNSIVAAIEEYYRIFNEYPANDAAAISRALLGQNPKKIKLLVWRSDRIDSANGALLDRWGEGYYISISKDQVEIRSSGPDREFQTADDLKAF